MAPRTRSAKKAEASSGSESSPNLPAKSSSTPPKAAAAKKQPQSSSGIPPDVLVASIIILIGLAILYLNLQPYINYLLASK